MQAFDLVGKVDLCSLDLYTKCHLDLHVVIVISLDCLMDLD